VEFTSPNLPRSSFFESPSEMGLGQELWCHARSGVLAGIDRFGAPPAQTSQYHGGIFIYLCIYLFMYLFIYLFYLFIYSFIYLYIYISLYIYIDAHICSRGSSGCDVQMGIMSIKQCKHKGNLHYGTMMIQWRYGFMEYFRCFEH